MKIYLINIIYIYFYNKIYINFKKNINKSMKNINN